MTMTTLLTRIFLGIIGFVCLGLGLLGLAVPLMPGFLFLGVAVICLASASPYVASKMAKNPRLGRFLNCLEAGKDLPFKDRVKLAGLACVEMLNGSKRS